MKNIFKPINGNINVNYVIKIFVSFLPLPQQKYNAPHIMTKINKLLMLFLTGLFFSCGGEDLDDNEMLAFTATNLSAEISANDLLGKWNINMLKTNVPVDLNGDGTENIDLLLETSCFDPMSITFFNDDTYAAVNARMDFAGGPGNDEFICMDSSETPDTGTWSLEGDTLTMTITVDGTIYTHEKKITYTGNSFSFDVDRLESQQYFTDPGDTMVSDVDVVFSEYIRATE